MIKSGYYQKLTIERDTEYGFFLCDNEQNEVLLPNRYVTDQMNIGDELEVFVYNDSEDRLVATTEKPYATASQVAFLEVVDKTIHGAFLGWGLLKDLFIPIKNQQGKMEVGQKYVVYIYNDNITGRVVASARLNSFISNEEITVKPKDEVEIMVAYKTTQGYRVVIENKNWGMVYDNQIFQPIQVGDKLRGFIHKITEDKRIDVSLQQSGYDEVKRSADKLVELIRSNGGVLNLNDNSSPEEVRNVTNMSKKVFKRSVGYLMKKGDLLIDNDSIRLK